MPVDKSFSRNVQREYNIIGLGIYIIIKVKFFIKNQFFTVDFFLLSIPTQHCRQKTFDRKTFGFDSLRAPPVVDAARSTLYYYYNRKLLSGINTNQIRYNKPTAYDLKNDNVQGVRVPPLCLKIFMKTSADTRKSSK